MNSTRAEIQQIFAERLVKLRKAAGLTQKQLAKELGVSRGAIGYYENCERCPDIAFLDATSFFFGVDTSYMLGETENLNPRNSQIGLRLNLSDKAIDFFENDHDFGAVLSEMIEQSDFSLFLSYCNAFLREERYLSTDLLMFQKGHLPISWSEVDEFRSYKIGELFALLIKQQRLNCQNKARNKRWQEKSEADIRKERVALDEEMRRAEETIESMISKILDSE